ncbi:putative small GTP-binding protein Rab28 [Leptomonas pyrrhocoris]|uniref:Putative small GTP-binding protein Rab28 n=1 Tax=Leptomonas pyrrhocoris TaxID=157538 RepID=A0A0N0VGB3_LEPPY|nr:putative small GTP-binding protein Rab28 [Leptomonas pyrrhocoris]XP_015661639.1 putative small GTP-binding protein Rab28 [Leptomonas pyrrhocoris]XP_015661640.1 putative small GTP-binding protein Rab28 [Leptomonas pyrrhocoris]KPA83199.1 putative small GTP-binding protein Rab28 [Leptomonas pyrrhocoris]KPA83200.1 putative small GTP-binding protein Rab28 [Leptomonas pyrrhocoris]KPA83201.1 putative small GTP-binding protein Rab28 [Leptomonas pyrrhocoris]|eukprot:XP_015661638.1 putative small GTP-binding protein Rab28 [Leptomonas pyrrhocoris]
MDSGSDASDDGALQFKVVVLGNGAVGKTSLIRHFCESGFTKSYKQTIGLDFYSRKVQLPHHHPAVTLQLWDIGGQQIGGKMLANYIHGSHAVCLVYDLTNANSFKDLSDWKTCVDNAFQDVPEADKPRMILVGNKADLPNRAVSEEDQLALCKELNVEYCTVSAQSGERVNTMFTRIAATLAGVEMKQQDLEMRDRVTANVVSRPEERKEAPRVAMLHATSSSHGKKKDDCTAM